MLRSLSKHTTQLRVSRCDSPFTSSISRYSTSALDWLASFTNYEQNGVPDAAGTDTADGFDLARVDRLMKALNSPHTAWPAVHIAGTKGKGSTASMISSILKESGYTVGTYTSPHVVSFNERIAINGTPITSAALDALVSKYKNKIEEVQTLENGALSHFEIVTALAYRYFADCAVDIAVIETGLGGTRDATNVLPKESVAAAVITAIGHDHAAALGGSIESIAAAKAGIMKPKRPVILARQPESVAAGVLKNHANEINNSAAGDEELLLRCADKEVRVVDQGENIFIQDGVAYQNCTFALSPWASNALGNDHKGGKEEYGKEELLQFRLRLVGQHQLDNAATAITTAAYLAAQGQHYLKNKITKESIIRGLENCPVLPGRFQICRLEANQGLAILDGAHTPESAAALVHTVRTLFPMNTTTTTTIDKNLSSQSPPQSQSPPVALVLAMAADKDLTGVCRELRELQPNVAVFTEVPIAGGKTRSAAPGALVGAWQAAGMMANTKKPIRPVRARELIQASLKAAVARAAAELKSLPNGDKGIIVVTGSMHAVGTALKDL